MKVALINPRWTFDGSIYFGCREPHLPVEYGYSRVLLEREGHETLIIDAQLEGLSDAGLMERVKAFGPDFSVITTAPSYLFWRCAPPELRVPQETIRNLRDCAGTVIVVGPHASTTPETTLRKLGADVAVLGECEEILPLVVGAPRDEWEGITSIAYTEGGDIRVQGAPHAANVEKLPALHWSGDSIRQHGHHHHRFEAAPLGPGAEMETSRGCPYRCSFCAKENFRSGFRRRPLQTILREIDGLISQGVEYVYFIDEIFLPNKELLESLVERDVKFGIQTRIDVWKPEMIDLLGRAGCVSIEAGVESITEEGRKLLDKNCKLSTDELTGRLVYARERVPFVQANMLDAGTDDDEAVEAWRSYLEERGIWANEPVPLFPYPGSPDYTKLWGKPDEHAWERAHEHYLKAFSEFSDIQEEQPLPLEALELSPAHA
ncbi:MAG: TIGR04295 family B12-binding domain-containing radical SAM protein [Dehalococcoidia bacterium]